MCIFLKTILKTLSVKSNRAIVLAYDAVKFVVWLTNAFSAMNPYIYLHSTIDLEKRVCDHHDEIL